MREVSDLKDKQQLQELIKQKLSTVANYREDVLPEYIMVMIGNRKTQEQVATALETFLGLDVAKEFSVWLWKQLKGHHSKEEKDRKKDRYKRNDEENGTDPMDSDLSSPSHSPHNSEVHSEVVLPESNRREHSAPPISGRLLLSAVKDAVASTSNQSNEDENKTLQNENISPAQIVRRIHPQQRSHLINNRFRSKNTNIPDPKDIKVIVTLDGTNNERKRKNEENESQENISPAENTDEPDTVENTSNSMETFTIESNPSKRIRCSFWPFCKHGNACIFRHPSEPCKNFPDCPFGDKCLFIHPSIPCKYGANCSRRDCQFHHPLVIPGARRVPKKSAKKHSVPACRYSVLCTRANCVFWHPKEICKFGNQCTRTNCVFRHVV